jgi:hypothetical protein
MPEPTGVDTHSSTTHNPVAKRRRRPKGKAGVEAATRARRYGNAEERIKRIVDAWPPLTAEQREKLALILCPGGLRE